MCIRHHLIIIMKPATQTVGFVSIRHAGVKLDKVWRKGLRKFTLPGSNESKGALWMLKRWVKRQKDEEATEGEGKIATKGCSGCLCEITSLPAWYNILCVWSYPLRERFVDITNVTCHIYTHMTCVREKMSVLRQTKGQINICKAILIFHQWVFHISWFPRGALKH